MAINPVPVQAIYKKSTTQSISIASGDGWSTPTSGNLIVLFVCDKSSDTTVHSPNFAAQGYTVEASKLDGGTAQTRAVIAWRVSTGTESTVAIDIHTSDLVANWHMIAAEFSQTDVDTSAVAAIASAARTTTSAASFASGAATNGTSNALCLSMLAVGNHAGWETGNAVDNDYTIRSPSSNTGGEGGLWFATKAASSVADQQCTWSTTDTGSTAWTATMIFDEAAASGGHTKLSGKLGYPLRGKLG